MIDGSIVVKDSEVIRELFDNYSSMNVISCDAPVFIDSCLEDAYDGMKRSALQDARKYGSDLTVMNMVDYTDFEYSAEITHYRYK